jgi:hypothetical protein
VASVAGGSGITVEPGHPDEVESTWADTSRCESLLGFRPVTDLDAVIARQVAALQPLAG